MNLLQALQNTALLKVLYKDIATFFAHIQLIPGAQGINTENRPKEERAL